MGERRQRTGTSEVQRTTGSNEVLDRLFVYGTLRRGQTARSLIASSIVRCEPASTTGQIYAFPMGYPAFHEGDATLEGRVVGEVLWLTDLAATFGVLDAYEGTDFVRGIRRVTIEGGGEDAGQELWAWIYVLADTEAVRLGTPIADGDWVRYWSEQT